MKHQVLVLGHLKHNSGHPPVTDESLGSLVIREKLAEQDPAMRSGSAISFNKIGDIRNAQGDLPAALKSYHDSFGIFEKLAKQEPGNAEWQRDLSLASNAKVGDIQSAQGDHSGALKSYRKSLAIAEN
jgi:tetratricopeptide (TPR) repeat protein